jgi:hypothetical protein
MLLGIAASFGAGCAAQPQGTAETAAPEAVPETEIVIDLETELLIGPSKARELGYRIDHQARTFPESESGIKRLAVLGDSVFVLDGRNFLTRLRRADGHRLWRIPVADPLDDIHGITHLDYEERVLLMAGNSLMVLDDNTGSLLQKQTLGQIASRSPAPRPSCSAPCSSTAPATASWCGTRSRSATSGAATRSPVPFVWTRCWWATTSPSSPATAR